MRKINSMQISGSGAAGTIGIKNIAGAAINPSTEDTLLLTKTAITAVETAINTEKAALSALLASLPVIYGEPYLSPQDFTVTYTSALTLTATGAPFDIDDSAVYVAAIVVKNAAGLWTKYINAHNGVSISSSSNVITIAGAGLTPFLVTDLAYRVAILGQEKAYDPSTDTEKVTEQSPISNKYVQDSLVDATNTAAATTYFPSATGMSMDGFSALSFTGKLITTGTITMTIEATNDEDTTNADWIQIYGYDNKNDVFINQYVITAITLTFAMMFNGLNYSNYRVKLVDTASTNTYIIKSRKVY